MAEVIKGRVGDGTEVELNVAPEIEEKGGGGGKRVQQSAAKLEKGRCGGCHCGSNMMLRIHGCLI